MWLIRKQVTWPIMRCFNDYDSDSGSLDRHRVLFPADCLRNRIVDPTLAPYVGKESQLYSVSFLFIQVVRGEETVPGSVWR